MKKTSSNLIIAEVVRRFIRLKRMAEPSWKSHELEMFILRIGENQPVDRITPLSLANFLYYLEAEVSKYTNHLGFEDQCDQDHCGLHTFLQFCYEMGFTCQDIRPILRLNSKQRAKLRSKPVPLPPRISYISLEGKVRIEIELEYLRTNQRPRVANWLANAASDSGPGRPAFDMPKEVQSFVEGRIEDLELLIKNAVIIESARKNFLFPECINVGDTVTIQELHEIETDQYTILGTQETDLSKGRVSFLSPLGQALLGQIVGDEIRLQVPAGDMVIQVLKYERRDIVYDKPFEPIDYVGGGDIAHR